ncbi:MAG: hypothetical protein IJO57_03950 [Bacilli bacterium]|nr:hypothetical protein [Bacilli bacterium]
MAEAILIIMILLMILTIFCLYKMYDKRGLYFSLVIINIIAFIFSFKVAEVLKLNINLGIVPFAGMMTILFMFILKYGIEEQKNLVKITLCSNIIIALLLIIMNYFVPATTETISINMQGTFEYNYKILIVYPIITAISQILSMKLFNIVNQIQTSIIISGILTYIMTALLYTVVYTVLIYIKIMEVKYNLFIGISSYILGLIVMIINIMILNTIYKKKVI